MLVSLPAFAGSEPNAYQRAIMRIDQLYLRPDSIDAEKLFTQAARGLADRVHWLIADIDGNTVRLHHGDGTEIGVVNVADIQDLDDALVRIETLVTESGYDLGETDVRLELLKGMTGALDRYSRVLSGERLEKFDVRLKGTLVGVGFTISLNSDHRLYVRSLFTGGPAERGGLQIDDELLRIDGRSTVNMPTSEAVRLIKGDKDSTVELELRRYDPLPADADEDAERTYTDHTVTLTREEIVVPNVISKTLEGNIGYIKITHISQRTHQNLLAQMDELRQNGALERGLVMDLRGNTGGSMKEAARSADHFVKSGLLLRTEGPDGGHVRNLQPVMEARDEGNEPQIPVAILMDERTASGSEIIAGALLELDRAVLVGTRSYGKGTVQKIYPLEQKMRLKLTVAQYVLANDRRIADVGLHPDVVVAQVSLGSDGVRFRGWDLDRVHTTWEEIIPHVVEGRGWRDESFERSDLTLELARRAVQDSAGPDRASTLASLRQHAEQVRIEQEGHLQNALESRDINWNPAPAPGDFIDGRVQLSTQVDPDDPDAILLRAEVENTGDTPLARALVQLDCDTLRKWDGVVIPVGWIEPGESRSGEVRVRLRPGLNQREDVVAISLRADGRPTKLVGDEVLVAQSSPRPQVRVSARLAEQEDGTRHAEVTVHNASKVLLGGVEVQFGYPGEVDVELVTQAARTPFIAPRGSRSDPDEHTFQLGIEVGPQAPPAIPLNLRVHAERYGRVARWPIALPLDGSSVQLMAPSIEATGRDLSAPVGPYTLNFRVDDDQLVDHVVVYLNGDKIHWAGGGRDRVAVRATGELNAGVNHFYVEARDNQGLRGHQRFIVRGEPSASSDAGDEQPPL